MHKNSRQVYLNLFPDDHQFPAYHSTSSQTKKTTNMVVAPNTMKGLVQIPCICCQQEVEKIAFNVVAIIAKRLIHFNTLSQGEV